VGGATYNVTATGGASGNPVTFTIDGSASAVCSISGSTVSFIGAGTCRIDANQAGDANYNAAPQAQQTFGVGKASQTITFPNPGPLTFTSGGSFALGATASSGLAVAYTSTTASVCTVSGSTVMMVGAGTCTITADQVGNGSYNAAPQVSDDIAVGKASQTINYTSTAPVAATVGGATYNVTATGGASANPVTFTIDGSASSVCSISGSTVSFIGAGTCRIDANQASSANYNAAAQAQQSFAVGKANQTITFTSVPSGSAAVGGANYNVTATGGASGNSITFTIGGVASSVCSISGSTVSFIGAGTCVIDANQAGNANYNAAPQAQQSFAVSAGALTLVFTQSPSSLNQGDMLGTVQVTEKDSLGNVMPTSGTVDFTVATACGTVDLGTAPMTSGVATLNSSQRFYTLTSSRQIAATFTTQNATSTVFPVLASGVLFADGFECRP
jgi:hypothetical protein